MNNINNFDCIINAGGVFWECGFNHKTIDVLETITGKGFYKIYDEFVFQNNLSAKTIIDLLAVSAYKKHGAKGMQKLKAILIANPELDLNELAVFKVHFKNLLPDMISFQTELNAVKTNCCNHNAVSDFYDFEGSYILALNFLKWSDTEFWNSTPKKLCFALLTSIKHNKNLENFNEKKQTENCINFLNSIKKML